MKPLIELVRKEVNNKMQREKTRNHTVKKRFQYSSSEEFIREYIVKEVFDVEPCELAIS